jgi:hypothetical protein
MKNTSHIDIDIIRAILHLVRVYSKELHEDFGIEPKGVKLVLEQLLRMIWIPAERRYVSTKCLELWKALFSDDKFFYDYNYRDKIIIDKDYSGEVIIFKGASSKGQATKVSKGDPIVFNDVFHDDHIIPISKIIKRLLMMSDLTEQKVEEVIMSSLSICRMLKTEDRNLKNKSNRPMDEDEIIQTLYRDKGITVQRL